MFAAAALLGLACAVQGCGRGAAISADVAVSIDGEEIRYDQFEAYLHEQVDREDETIESDVQSELFDQFLDGQLLIRLAIERGLVFGESAIDERRAVAFLLRDGFRRTWSDEELAAYYEAHRDRFQRPEEAHVRQILVQERARAEAAQQALATGEDFVQVSARFSEGPKAHLGGDQGRLAFDDLPVAFRETIFGLQPGEVSGIVAADYGFLIFQVVARFAAETVPLEQVANEIRRTLRRRHVDELIARFLDEARQRYDVEVFPENFPFGYQGTYAKGHTHAN